MSRHNVLCTLCVKALKSSDDICSTSCGHIFHFVCMTESQYRSTYCPECKCFNPTIHKMFLAFDESENEELYNNNWNDKLKIIELHKQIEESKNNCLHLQEKYSVSQDLVRKLEGRIKKVDSSVAQRILILSDLEDRVNTLEELNNFLTIDNECKSKALSLKSAEIAELQNSLREVGNTDSVTSVLSKKIDILQRKLENKSKQLDNEVANCSQLSTDKIKLLKYIDLKEVANNGKKETTNDGQFNRVMLSNPDEKRNTQVACAFNSLKSNQNLPHFVLTDIKQMPQCSIDENNFKKFPFHEDLNYSIHHCLLIKNFPANELKYPLTELICSLTSIEAEDDIRDVYIKDGNGKTDKQKPKNVTLFVQFNNIASKTKFLSNEYNIYERFPYLELTEINDYESDDYEGDDKPKDLLMYARHKLCQNGFPIIFRQNDEIIALKGRNDCKGIKIISKNQVNKLFKSNLRRKQNFI